jgi:transcriptional regulator with XRE-family HTH domain
MLRLAYPLQGGRSCDDQEEALTMSHPPINLADLGRRIREVRLARQLTLEDVVSRANFTISWLSKLETGQLSPSLDGLVRLAGVLGCGVDRLVAGLVPHPQHVVTRKGTGRQLPQGKQRSCLTREDLADCWPGRAIHPLLLHLSGKEKRGKPESLSGERFLYVIDGQVALEYGNESFLLGPGDSIYLDSAIPHCLMPAGQGPAQVLSVHCILPDAPA